MRTFRRTSSTSADEDNPYWMSYSDLMSALLIIFLLAVVALLIELTIKNQSIDIAIDDLETAQQARELILKETKDILEKHNIKVEITDNETVLRIPESTLAFESGKNSIPTDNSTINNVITIGQVLHESILKGKRFIYLDTVFIEGHTDGVPIHYRGKGNWGLSADRAISVWKLWEANSLLTPSMNSMQNAFGQQLFSVSGYADTRKVQVTETTAAERRKNRRIDIRFTVKKPAIKDFEAIIQ